MTEKGRISADARMEIFEDASLAYAISMCVTKSFGFGNEQEVKVVQKALIMMTLVAVYKCLTVYITGRFSYAPCAQLVEERRSLCER